MLKVELTVPKLACEMLPNGIVVLAMIVPVPEAAPNELYMTMMMGAVVWDPRSMVN